MLSAIKGFKVVTPAFEPYVLPITVVIIIDLFMAQAWGTASVASFIGQITIVWFLVIATTGVPYILKSPEVLVSF